MNEQDLPLEVDKPSPSDWSILMNHDDDFAEEFGKIINNEDIPEADANFTPEVFDDTYLNMELALPRDEPGPEFASVTKRLRDHNGLPIGTANQNQILDSQMYVVEYQDGHKASLSANTIAQNMSVAFFIDLHGHILSNRVSRQGRLVPILVHNFIHSAIKDRVLIRSTNW